MSGSRPLGLGKLVGALLLLASLFLPMTSCTSQSRDGAPAETTYQWAWSPSRWSDPAGYLIVFAFTWPAAVVIARRRLRTPRAATTLQAAEPVLLAGSAYVVHALSDFGDPELGLFVAVAGLVLYALGWLADIARHRRAWTAPPRPA
jgi:hypothetical protein